MLVLTKIIILLSAFFFRFNKKNWNFLLGVKRPLEEISPNLKGSISVRKSKNCETSRVYLHFPCKVQFKLSRESIFDSIFKFLGVSQEVQTNDSLFDKRIYIACDSFSLKKELITDAITRKLILDLFSNDCVSILCDGEELEFTFVGSSSIDSQALLKVSLIYQQMMEMKSPKKGWSSDPFNFKILLIESIVWSIGAYAVIAFFEIGGSNPYLDHASAIKIGLLTGLILAFIFLFSFFYLVRGSSRGHRVLIESFFLLLFALPQSGIAIVDDINTSLDKSDPILFTADVAALRESSVWRRRFSLYHVDLVEHRKSSDLRLPGSLKIDVSTYVRLKSTKQVTLVVRRGFLGLPWVQNIEGSLESDY